MSDRAARPECVIAVDIGGGTTKLALVNREGTLEQWSAFPTASPDADVFLARTLAAICDLQEKARVPLHGLAVSAAGFVSAGGVLTFNANLPWLEGARIGEVLERGAKLPVHVEADSNAACLAEYVFGSGCGTNRFLCLTGGTGLGVGMIAENKLLRIAHGCMGDAGHVIVAPDGPACSCGGRGCAEALVSTAVLRQRYGAMLCQEVSFRQLVEDSLRAASAACLLMEEAGRALGVAAASLASIFFPDRIAVAGGLAHAGETFFRAAEQSFRSHVGSLPASRATLALANSGAHAPLLGAAACLFYPELL